MSHTTLTADWLQWIDENKMRNCDLNEMVEILVSHNIPFDVAHQAVFNPADNQVTPSIYIPTAKRTSGDNAEVFAIDNFLLPYECLELISLIRNHHRPSTTTNDQGKYQNYRTSQTCDLSLLNSPLVSEIDRRICKMLGISADYSEGIQGQWYNIGEEFKEHTDYFEPKSTEFNDFAAEQGQRTWTFMIYLNTTQAGGTTFFPKLNLSFAPSQGRAVIWKNLKPDGSPNPVTLHHGMPVEEGYKAIITKWFRIKGKGTPCIRERNENIPSHTQTGFLTMPIPTSLFHQLLTFHANNREHVSTEQVPDFIHSKEGTASGLIELSSEIKTNIHKTLQPIAEAWSGCLIEPTYVYGIREYYRGAVLEPHRDRLQTHEISLILNIHQKADNNWPLLIEDHHYRQHQVYLTPGLMVLYEGCRLLHGRPAPFEGDFFANIFVHYSLKNQ